MKRNINQGGTAKTLHITHWLAVDIYLKTCVLKSYIRKLHIRISYVNHYSRVSHTSIDSGAVFTTPALSVVPSILDYI